MVILNRVEIVLPKETFILPPEGQDIECDEKKLTEQVKKMAAEAARLLTEKNKNGKVESKCQSRKISMNSQEFLRICRNLV